MLAAINQEFDLRGDPRTEVSGISNDSRMVKRGQIYVALVGEHVDGHRFIGEAIKRGARAIVQSAPLDSTELGVVYLRTEEPRRLMSRLSAAFYEFPSQRVQVIGITGTDGKTSTTWFTHQLLKAAGFRSGFLSTAAAQTGSELRRNIYHQSTPEAPEVHRLLAEIADAGNDYAVLESTSHGLSHKSYRLADVSYRAAVLTTLGHEHLEYHGTFENYRSDKANLFRQLDPTGVGVINAASEHADYFEAASAAAVRHYRVVGASPSGIVERATKNAAGDPELLATVTAERADGSEFLLSGAATGADSAPITATLPVPGGFNVENALAAILTVAEVTGRPVAELAPLLAGLTSAPGRVDVVARTPFTVVVDYAHTPGSFARVLPMFAERTAGRLIVVFGSAGERDTAKRPLQGELASRYADVVILADEDPRGEDPMAILSEIAAGCDDRQSEVRLVPDRREAIARAFRCAQPGDTVLLLGKGHEASIIYATGAIEWDERKVAIEELELGGYQWS